MINNQKAKKKLRRRRYRIGRGQQRMRKATVAVKGKPNFFN